MVLSKLCIYNHGSFDYNHGSKKDRVIYNNGGLDYGETKKDGKNDFEKADFVCVYSSGNINYVNQERWEMEAQITISKARKVEMIYHKSILFVYILMGALFAIYKTRKLVRIVFHKLTLCAYILMGAQITWRECFFISLFYVYILLMGALDYNLSHIYIYILMGALIAILELRKVGRMTSYKSTMCVYIIKRALIVSQKLEWRNDFSQLILYAYIFIGVMIAILEVWAVVRIVFHKLTFCVYILKRALIENFKDGGENGFS